MQKLAGTLLLLFLIVLVTNSSIQDSATEASVSREITILVENVDVGDVDDQKLAACSLKMSCNELEKESVARKAAQFCSVVPAASEA